MIAEIVTNEKILKLNGEWVTCEYKIRDINFRKKRLRIHQQALATHLSWMVERVYSGLYGGAWVMLKVKNNHVIFFGKKEQLDKLGRNRP